MVEERTRLEEALRVLNTICLFVTLGLIGLLLGGTERMLTQEILLGTGGLAGIVLLFELFARHFRKLWLFTLAHVGALAVYWALFPEGGRPYRMVLAAALTLLAYKRRLDKMRSLYPSPYIFVIYAVLYFVGAHAGPPLVCSLCVAAEIMTLFLCLFYYNQRALSRTEKELGYFVEVPREKLGATNTARISVWAGAAAVLIAVTVLWGPGSSLFDRIRAGLLWILRVIVRGIIWIVEVIASLLDLNLSNRFWNEDAEMELPFTGSGNPFLERLWDIMGTLLMIACAVLLVLATVRAIRRFLRRFAASSPEASRETAERISPKERQNRARGGGFERPAAWFTPRSTVRREYRNFLIGSGMADRFKASDTPEKLENTAYPLPRGTDMQDTDPMAQVHAVYERARYSGGHVTMRDISLIRRAIQNFHQKKF